MSLLLWLVFGALAGWLATLVMGVNRRVACLATCCWALPARRWVVSWHPGWGWARLPRSPGGD